MSSPAPALITSLPGVPVRTSLAGVPTMVWLTPKHSWAGSCQRLNGGSPAQGDDDSNEKCDPDPIHEAERYLLQPAASS